jgi:FKBP-type peptidyl-prolyl cis-trans isomerase
VPKRSLPQFLSAIAVAGMLIVSLAACTGSSSASGCTPTAAGSSSGKVTVSGKVGSKPTVKFAKKLTTKTTERTAVTTGSGKVAEDGTTVGLSFVAYNATSGKLLDTEGYGSNSPVALTVSKTNEIEGLYKAVHCSPAGTRVTAVVPPAEAFGTSGSTALGLSGKDSVVFVIDVKTVKAAAKVLDKPDSTFPKVVFDAKTGAPTVTIPKATQPKDLKIAYLSKGKGATVKDGDTVTVNYAGVVWKTGTVFQSSWTDGAPVSFATNQVVTGFGKALVGQKVGSKIIVIIPPAEGYGSTGNADIKVSGTDDIVFVIQIISTKAS